MIDAERWGTSRQTAEARRATPILKLVPGTADGAIATSAARVVKKLGGAPIPTNVREARRRYTQSRKPLIAPREEVGEIIHVRPRIDDAPSMAVIRPYGSSPGQLLPALIFLHGGGWSVGCLETYESLCRQIANATGSVVVYVDYRLAPEHPFPAAFHDTRNALRWVHENHAWLGIDPRRIGIGGDSSGGNLAAAACLAERNDRTEYRPAFQLLIYPCLDMLACLPSHKELAKGYLLTAELYGWYRQNYLGGFEKPGHWRMSPLFAHDVSGLPATVMLYAGFDPLRDEAAVYAKRLAEAGNRIETLYFPDMIHGFVNMGGVIPEAHAAIARIAKALRPIIGN